MHVAGFSEKPGSPSGKLRASKVAQDSVTLDWLPPMDDGGSPLTAYIIEAKDSKAKDWSVFLCLSVCMSVFVCICWSVYLSLFDKFVVTVF